MGKSLVIVESPAKAKTINKILGPQFVVKACMGHIRDLPKGQFGIDIENGFEPHYRVIPAKQKILKELRSSVKKADALYLAPDPDREGEAIAWHLLQALDLIDPTTVDVAPATAPPDALPVPPAGTAAEKAGTRRYVKKKKAGKVEAGAPIQVYRVSFNEITKRAVLEAFKSPGRISMDKVHAQQARRLLDRIVGYKLSPLLWKKVGRGLSAGRVQSVAVRLVVEREKEINAFKPEEYWSIGVTLATPDGGAFLAELRKRDGKEIPIPNEATAKALVAELERCRFAIAAVSSKEKQETPPPPFTTSLLQQQASIRLGFSTRKTMTIAQQLYEGLDIGEEGAVGLITYMRTDSFRIADEAQAECRTYIPSAFGAEYLEPAPRVYATKASAQGAHEAVRPTSAARTPEALQPFLSEDQFRLYRLIWKRFVATQMSAARYRLTDATIDASPPDGGSPFALQAKGRELLFDGFTRVAGQKLRKDEQLLPPMTEGAALQPSAFAPVQHFTQPPPRYSEASLVKALEKFGIGRPSTYAPIIGTIQDRGYVRQEERKLHATELGTLVTDKLVNHFDDILNTGFTSRMESELDKIEEAQSEWKDILSTFHAAFEKDLQKATEEMKSAGGIEPETKEPCPKCGSPMVIRWNQSGKFLGCSAFPNCKSTKSIGSPETGGVTCEKCGKPMVVKTGRFGRFLACAGYPDCRNTRPFSARTRRVQIPSDFKMDCEKCGKPIVVKFGRRGGFLACSGYPDCRNTKPFPKEWYIKKDQEKPPEDREETIEEAGVSEEEGEANR
jgi:DNA topoisomerase-1